MSILSIDLATRDYRDIGFAHLETGSRQPKFLKPEELHLSGAPSVLDLAVALNAFCSEHNVTTLLIDAPHAWKDPKSGVQHMRIAERVLNTPGKTGTVGHVKPGTLLNFTIFSVALFQTMRKEYGWNLLTSRWTENKQNRYIVESFPTASWRTLGLDPLPGKSRARKADLKAWRDQLQQATGYSLPEKLSHDELQAAVMLPAGEAISSRDPDRVLLLGVQPSYNKAGDVIEGYIAVPRSLH